MPFAIISATLLLNMLLHDQLVLERIGASLHDPIVERLRLVNAFANVLCFVGWALLAALRSPVAAAASAPVSYWPRRSTAVGLEVTHD